MQKENKVHHFIRKNQKKTEPIKLTGLKNNPTERAKGLREIYFNALSSVDMEFPYWYTRRFKELDGEVAVVRRAEALKTAFTHLTVNIWPNELLVGGKTAYYRGSYPLLWLSCSYFNANAEQIDKDASKSIRKENVSTADDMSKFGTGGGNVTKSFGNVISIAGKFGLKREEVAVLLKLSKAWQDSSIEALSKKYEKLLPDYKEKEVIMDSLICMFDSGYTLPQGREVASYYYPLQYGYDALIAMAKEKQKEVAGFADGDGILGMERLYFYKAVEVVLEGIQLWYLNHAKKAKKIQNLTTTTLKQKKELQAIAERMEWLAHKPPRDFHDALQMVYLIHIAVLNEDAISGLSPGRLGQVLYPWFAVDIEEGKISESDVLELLECYRIKMTNIDCFASMGVVGGVLSGNTFNNVSLGGLNKKGQSAANRLEMLMMEAGITCPTTQPTLTVLYDEKLPEEFLLKAIESNKTGVGYPAWVNNRNAIDFLIKQYGNEGMDLEEARAFAIGGCLETSPCSWMELDFAGRKWEIPCGSGQPTSVGVHFIANPKVLELVLMNGVDERTGKKILPPHNRELKTYEEIWQTFTEYYEYIVEVLVRANNIQHDLWRKNNMSVFNSLLKPDCLALGQHIGNMGYRYNATFNIESCGQVTAINALTALKKLVYDEKKYTLKEMKKAILENFGYIDARESGSFSMSTQVQGLKAKKYAQIHHDCLNASKYGNDDVYADQELKRYEEWFCDMCTRYESLYGLPMYACQISVSTHGAQGAVTLASTDGRLSGTTYADGSMSAYPGTDKNGVYALFASATSWDQTQSQNSQLNLKMHPIAVEGKGGTIKLLNLTRGYLRQGGFHVQYNVVESETLKAAQKEPDKFRDLMVRVAGFTQYWVELGKPIQDEVIARTEYERV